MKLEKIISISGKPGLYKLINQQKNGFVVEDVISKKKLGITNSSQVSLLDNISIFTADKEMPLFEVMENIAKNENYGQTISHKSSDEQLRAFMEKSLPDYDKERVYISDIKKLAQWYNLLQEGGFISPESFVKEEESHENLPKIEERHTAVKPKSDKIEGKTASKAVVKKTRVGKKV